MHTEHPTYPFFLSLLYLAGVTAAGLLVSRKGRDKNASEYFLGSRSLGAMGLGASLFVTSIGSMWLMGAANAVPWLDNLGLWYGVLAIVFVLILRQYFAPLYLKSNVFTVPQFISFRFDTSTALWFSALSILFYVGVKVPLLLTLASWMMERVLGLEMMTSAGLLVVVILIGLYTVAGGFVSLIRTQAIQAAVVLVGTLLMATWVLIEPSVIPQKFSLSLYEGSEHSWMPYVLGLPVIVAWHWFADQCVIQRVLATRDLGAVRRGTLLGAALMVVGGLLFIVVASHAASPMPAGSSESSSTMWFKGVGSVVFLALLMASLASDFHSAATLFTMDFYRTAYPESRDESLVLVGRLSTTMIVILAILAVSTVSLVDAQLIALLQQFQVHVAPPIVAVFLFGVFWKRTSSRGALWGLVLGELFGAFDMAVRFLVSTGRLNDGMFGGLGSLSDSMSLREGLLAENLFAFGIISFVLASLIVVGGSLLTAAPSSETSMYMSILKRKVG